MRTRFDGALFEAIADGATVITAGHRLAQSLVDDFLDSAAATALHTPTVIPLAGWYAAQWQLWRELRADPESAPPPLLLGRHHSLTLWEQVIRDDPPPQTPGNPLISRLAMQAWTLCGEHAIALDHEEWQSTPESRAFQRWARVYAQRLTDNHQLDEPSLAGQIVELIGSGALSGFKMVRFAGFDTLAPQTQTLIQTLARTGCDVAVAQPRNGQPATAYRCACRSPEQEIRRAARWARRLLEGGSPGPIGVVIPDLGQQRTLVERTFVETLTPGRAQSAIPAPGDADYPFTLSLGVPLSDRPLIRTALDWLEWCLQPQPLEQVSTLLRSPFWGHAAAEADWIARLDRQLRRRHSPMLGLPAVAAEATRLAAAAGGGLRTTQILNELVVHCAQHPHATTPSAWSRLASDTLKLLQWPPSAETRDGALESSLHQQVEQFQQLLREAGGLDHTQARMDGAGWLQWVRRMAADRIHQPRSAESPVTILGLYETSGLHFEHLWVSGMTADTWPPTPESNPLIPKRLQRLHAVPGADADQERRIADARWQALLASGRETVFSHPELTEDRPALACHHILEIPSFEQIPGYDDTLAARQLGSAHLESLQDHTGVGLPAGSSIAGGQAVITRQSLCPFSAYGQFRLHAVTPETTAPGLDARDRGNLVHYALEQLFRDIPRHDQLVALTDSAGRQMVEDAATAAIDRLVRDRPTVLTTGYRQLELMRLSQLLTHWLELERQRAPFTVEQTEQRHEVTIGGLTLTIRADRIDRCSERGRVIFDYKTSATRRTMKSVHGTRPDEAQLPLYAVTDSQPVGGIAYANVHPRTLDWRGESEASTDDRLIGNKPDPERDPPWGGQLAIWRSVIEALADGFRRGEATVDPKSLQAACAYCNLTPFCRITELAVHPEATDDAE